MYGAGSSRDWAVKGPLLLGVRAVIAESFERIHRSNLVEMGVLPLEFPESQSAATLGLDGTETYAIATDAFAPNALHAVTATAGLLAAKILATSDEALLKKLKDYSKKLKEQVEAKDAKLQEIGYKKYMEK